jgi:hypothetical protein
VLHWVVYQKDIFRLTFDVHHCELTFIASDLDEMKATELACFLAELEKFRDNHNFLDGFAYQWPLFCHERSYPHYAWTKAAKKFYHDRHGQRQMAEAEANRRRRAIEAIGKTPVSPPSLGTSAS